MDSDQKDDSVPETKKEEEEEGGVAAGWSSSLGGFEVTVGRLEQLMKSTEVLLSEVEQLRGVCCHQATELVASATELRRQQEDLKESYAGLSRDLQEVVDTMEELLSTEGAIDVKERQSQKLDRLL